MRRAGLVLFLLAAALSTSARTLSWRDFNVDANLDRDGKLHIAETQTMVFDGDWNGGERRFRVSGNQSLHVENITRVASDGSEVPLAPASLDQVDHYQMMDGNVLRWRSRMPSDPSFDHTAITYRIRYTLSGVIGHIGSTYSINHDFSCPDCDGAIDHFRLHFTTDPVWRGIESPLNIEMTDLTRGRGVIVKRELTYTGAAKPSAVNEGAPVSIEIGFTALLLIGVALLGFSFFMSETTRGRFAFTPRVDINEAWLKEHVFRFPPEVAGAALHDKVGPPEVAAVIAALAQEKKIETSVEKRGMRRPKLTMRRLADDIESDHRDHLVQKLFFGRREVDTDAIRKHYKSSGFDPAAAIRSGIEQQLSRIPKWNSNPRLVNWWIDAGLLVAAVVLFPLLGRNGNDSALASTGIFFGVISLIPALIAAAINSRAVTNFTIRIAIVGAFLLPLLVTMTKYLAQASRFFFTIPSMIGGMLWTLAIVHIVLDVLRIRGSEEKIAIRVKLASARAYFLSQLRESEPQLRDDWFPYLIAFGLGDNVDSWFGANAKSASSSTGDFATSSSSVSSSSSSSSSGGWGWTGGGGAFGGAGASASWAIAAGAVSSGVSAPSSSSSGGGGGGGGSSSGGGGGGGW